MPLLALDDGLLRTSLLSLLGPQDLDAGMAPVSRRIRLLASHDSLWRPLCASRWAGRWKEKEWHAAGSDGQWRTNYIERERSIFRTMPVFLGRASLKVGHRHKLFLHEACPQWHASPCGASL